MLPGHSCPRYRDKSKPKWELMRPIDVPIDQAAHVPCLLCASTPGWKVVQGTTDRDFCDYRLAYLRNWNEIPSWQAIWRRLRTREKERHVVQQFCDWTTPKWLGLKPMQLERTCRSCCTRNVARPSQQPSSVE